MPTDLRTESVRDEFHRDQIPILGVLDQVVFPRGSRPPIECISSSHVFILRAFLTLGVPIDGKTHWGLAAERGKKYQGQA